MSLSNTAIKNAKPKDKAYKLSDEKGLYLEVSPKGGKWWRFKYRFEGKEKRISLGTYPDTNLKLARSKRDDARTLLAQDIDPSAQRKTNKLLGAEAAKNSFKALALEWHQKFLKSWTEGHAKRILRRFEADVFPWLGNKALNDISAPELLQTIRRIEGRDAVETAHRALQSCSQVFRYGVATGKCERDISADLRGALTPVKVKHHASITDPKAIGALLRSIDEYEGHFVTQCALKLASLFFVRPGELRQAEWSEIDFDTSEWRIPGKADD